MKSSLKFVLIATFFFLYTEGQLAKCGSGWSCVLLAECPAFLKTSRSNTDIRRNICGFHKKVFAKVCCEDSKVRTRDKADSLLSKESLLPKPGKCGMPKSPSLNRIHGGSPAPIGAYPWMVAIGYQDVREEGEGKPRFECGGSLINSRYVLTAAHCLDRGSLGQRKLTVIHLGDWDVSKEIDCQNSSTVKFSYCAPPHITAGVEEVVLHPQFNSKDFSSDIGLIRLNLTINFEITKALVAPICLPPKNEKLEDITLGRKVMTAAGWGLTENRKSSDILMHVQMSFADNEKCRESYSNFKEESQLCIGGMGRDDTCAGDSGGPVFMPLKQVPPYVQLGVVAYGFDPCALEDVPSVYTSVAENREWIVENLKP